MNKPIRTHDIEHERAPPPAPQADSSNGHDQTDESRQLMAALPERRVKVFELGMLEFQNMGAERDELRDEVAALKIEMSARQVELEAMRSRIADMESRVATAVLMRDQAVAERAIYETLFISFQAQLRAFKIPAAPLVVANDEAAPEDIV